MKMTSRAFETLLDKLCAQLAAESRTKVFSTSKAFEDRVRDSLQTLVVEYGLTVDFNPHPFAFPDIAVGEFGVEVKFTVKDTWRSIANSIFETFRSQEAVHIYVVFGKMGGQPDVKWMRYEDSVIHVRTSHVPRFELEMDARSSLFSKMKISYADFCALSIEGKMRHIRNYAKARLKAGERLWWIEETAEQAHSLPLEVRLYIDLPSDEKRRLRAEATLLCPGIVAGSREKKKYNDVALYLLTYHGVLASQVRDLFSAGSVAMASDRTRGGNYILRAIADLEKEMEAAALSMDDALFIEYWGSSVPPAKRISKWLELADEKAKDWVPSQSLFLKRA